MNEEKYPKEFDNLLNAFKAGSMAHVENYERMIAYIRELEKEMDEAMNLLRHIHGYLYLNWADNGTLKDRIEAFLAKHKERING